jgi:hypothetical protein
VTWLACLAGRTAHTAERRRGQAEQEPGRDVRAEAGAQRRKRPQGCPRRDPRSSAPASGQLLDQPRDAERELTGEAVQRTATESTALKQGVRQLTAGNRSLAGRLEAARSSNRIPAGASPISGLSSPGKPPALSARVRVIRPGGTYARSAAGLITQWLLRRTRSAKVTSRSPVNRKPRERQMPLEGAFDVTGNACTSPQRCRAAAP